jgi:hypothetical protein
MRRTIIFVLLLILQVACSFNNPAPASQPTTPVLPVISTQSPIEQGIFRVTAWVVDPTPPLNSHIVVRGSLIKYGVYLGGIMMLATWPDENHERGVPNCSALVTYGTGKCVIDVSRFPPGIFVPVTVTFNYMGKTYSAQTGFTPQEP